jgi:hypothetical protein
VISLNPDTIGYILQRRVRDTINTYVSPDISTRVTVVKESPKEEPKYVTVQAIVDGLSFITTNHLWPSDKLKDREAKEFTSHLYRLVMWPFKDAGAVPDDAPPAA